MRQDPGPLPFLQEALTFATFEYELSNPWPNCLN